MPGAVGRGRALRTLSFRTFSGKTQEPALASANRDSTAGESGSIAVEPQAAERGPGDSVFAVDLDGDGDTDALSASAFDSKIGTRTSTAVGRSGPRG